MAYVSQLPCDGDGVCMRCTTTPSDAEKLTCKTCVTPWHVACLATKPETLASTLQWECPDCAFSGQAHPAGPASGILAGSGDLVAAIRAIETDASLTEQEKAKRRQELLSGKAAQVDAEDDDGDRKKGTKDVLDVLDGIFNCAFCMQLPERPVTTPCGHNFCLKCFQKWVGQGKRSCAKCRGVIPSSMASQPRINASLVGAIRMAKMSNSNVTRGPVKIYHYLQNQDRPDQAFTTKRAQRTGKANAASGKIFVTIPADHFGPITAENDPKRNQGVLVGESWKDRLDCRQWGVHFPHVPGIAGQSKHGAQSVVLSGGYLDDEDHGEWFLYTGSGGRDLSGNRRTNKDQSFDQTFDKYNRALQVSCLNGYPVRVVRSHKEKRSSYAPETGVRYDGCYRVEKCWKKVGVQGYKVCRFLFVRCDNEPAPWTSDEHGDRPRPLPSIPELNQATDITERKQSPSWDFDEKNGSWIWKKPAPVSRKPVQALNPEARKRSRKAMRKAQNTSVRERLLKEFSCQICRQVMTSPITTPCAHNFCKSCLEGAFAGKSFVTERSRGERSLRSQKNVMKCPSCPTDISDFLRNPQVNTEVMDMIESLKSKNEEEEKVDPTDELSEEGNDDSEDEGSTELSEGTDVNDGDQNSPTKCKPTRGPKRLKVDAGENSTKADDGKANEIDVIQTDGLKEDSELGNPEESNKSKAPVAKRGRKAAGQGGDGEKTRGRKRSQEKEASSDEGNGSPSSPLQVQSDQDRKEAPAKCGRKAAGQGGLGTKTRGRKAAGQGGVGTKTRGRKKAQVKEASSDQGNCLPSSPLQVQSDEDPKVSVKSEALATKLGRKAAGNVGVGAKTRGRKKAQVLEALGDEEGNASPSSPLHVKSDEDFE